MQRRRFLALTVAAIATGCERVRESAPPATVDPTPPSVPEGLTMEGSLQQGGYAIGVTTPHAEVVVDGDIPTTADADGRFVVGFDRDAPAQSMIVVTSPTGWSETRTLDIVARQYEEQTVRGLPRGDEDSSEWFDLASPHAMATDQDDRGVDDPLSAEDAARVTREVALKSEAWASRADSGGFAQSWRKPVPGRETSPWGSRRNYTGSTRTRTHYGVDLAGGVTTQILAPAAGVIVLAQDLYYEGGCVFIDHGQGFISHYLHMSQVIARVGQVVSQDDVVGFVGNTGRANGYHLCWQLHWRGRHLDPTLLVPTEQDADAQTNAQ